MFRFLPNLGLAEAIRTTVVPISGVIRTTVVPIILQVLAIGTTGVQDFLTSLRMYSIINLALNELIRCFAIEIHSKLTFWLIMNKKLSLI